MAKTKKAAAKKAPAKKTAKKLAPQKAQQLPADQQDDGGSELDGLTEEQKVSNVLNNNAT